MKVVKLIHTQVVVFNNREGGINLKKYVLFVGSFTLAFIVLQVLSGMLLTLFYTPSSQWEKASALSSQVMFGDTSNISPLVISLIALVIAFASVKLINNKAVH